MVMTTFEAQHVDSHIQWRDMLLLSFVNRLYEYLLPVGRFIVVRLYVDIGQIHHTESISLPIKP